MKHILQIFILLLGPLAFAQVFEADVDRDRILIGEPVELTIKANLSEIQGVTWPKLDPDTLTLFEILTIGPIDTLQTENRWTLQQQLTITSFDSGFFVLPPFLLTLVADSLLTEPILIQVGMPEIDAEVPIYDIKDIRRAPFDWVRLIWWLFFAGVIALTAYFVVKLIKSKGRKPMDIPAVQPQIPAHIEALQALQQLRREAHWEREAFKTHYDQLTAIFRRYIFRRYDVPALEYTSNELLTALRTRGLLVGYQTEIESMLRAADMAKFAKGRTDAFTAQQMLDIVVAYVEKTKGENPKQG